MHDATDQSYGTIGKFKCQCSQCIHIYSQNKIPRGNWAIGVSSFSIIDQRWNNNISLKRKFKQAQIHNPKSSFRLCAEPKHIHTHSGQSRIVCMAFCFAISFLLFYIALDRVLCAIGSLISWFVLRRLKMANLTIECEEEKKS